MVRFPTFHRPEHEKARSHLTMVRFPTFHRPEHEKARSHLTILARFEAVGLVVLSFTLEI